MNASLAQIPQPIASLSRFVLIRKNPELRCIPRILRVKSVNLCSVVNYMPRASQIARESFNSTASTCEKWSLFSQTPDQGNETNNVLM